MAADIPCEIGAEGAWAGAHLLSRPAEEFCNDATIETAWAIKATEHMEVYFNLLCSLDPKLLKLTPHDDQIYTEFKKEFPDFPLNVLGEEMLKSSESKEKWRPFCNKFSDIVEDYNFGTLVRLNSSDEYSDSNTIFVPRIQFYAIEIARNREGYNDEIRSKFQPISRKSRSKQKERQNSSHCFITTFSSNVQKAFNDICTENSIPQVCVGHLLKKENGSEKRGDFSLFLGTPQTSQLSPYLKQVSEKLRTVSAQWILPLSRCKIATHHLLQFSLDRSAACRNTLVMLMRNKEKYGMNCKENKHSILLAVYNEANKKCDLTALRTALIAQHLSSILLANGFQVHLTTGTLPYCETVPLPCKGVNCIKCTEQCTIKNLHHVWEDRARKSRWRVNPKKLDISSQSSMDTHSSLLSEDIILDGREYLNEMSSNENTAGYDKNIHYIYVKTQGLTECTKNAIYLEHIIQHHLMKVPEWIVYIVPHHQGVFMQQSGLTLTMLTEENIKRQVYLIHGPVTNAEAIDQHENSMESYFRRRQSEMEIALVHKYGSKVLIDEMGKSCINTLVDTTIKFDLLSTSPSLSVKLAVQHAEEGKVQDKKRGTFVQYNCARLAMLFSNHLQMVHKGYYNPLPELEEVDFNLLKLQEEWNLLFNYILPFPQLVTDMAKSLQHCSSVKIQFPVHKICQMLISLSHDLSAYYSRIHVLGEPQLHLQRTMAARLWLLQGVHQVMKNSLDLVVTKALEQM